MSRVFCAYLRQPYDETDPRTDPKYEEGSFGSTGCHSTNLLSEKGYRRNRIQRGDRLVFVQQKRVVFITPPSRQIRMDKDHHVVVYWNSGWKSKLKRPLKFNYAMELDLTHSRILNPSIKESEKIISHLRSYSQPLRNPRVFIQDYEDFVQKQNAEYGKTVFVERYCQTFCNKDKCGKCIRLAKSKDREKNLSSSSRCEY